MRNTFKGGGAARWRPGCLIFLAYLLTLAQASTPSYISDSTYDTSEQVYVSNSTSETSTYSQDHSTSDTSLYIQDNTASTQSSSDVSTYTSTSQVSVQSSSVTLTSDNTTGSEANTTSAESGTSVADTSTTTTGFVTTTAAYSTTTAGSGTSVAGSSTTDGSGITTAASGTLAAESATTTTGSVTTAAGSSTTTTGSGTSVAVSSTTTAGSGTSAASSSATTGSVTTTAGSSTTAGSVTSVSESSTTTGSATATTGSATATTGSGATTTGSATATTGSATTTTGSATATTGSATTTTGSATATTGSATTTTGSATATTGSATTTTGSATATTGSGATTTGSATATTGSATTTTGSATATTGSGATTTGSATATTGSGATTTGSATATTGSATTTTGSATATTGSATSTTGSATATTGSATATTGSVTTTAVLGTATTGSGTTTSGSVASPTTTTSSLTTGAVSTTSTTTRATTTTRTTTPAANSCGGSRSGSGGVIASPNYPNIYPNNKDCVWDLTGNVGERIRLSFVTFDIQDDLVCSYDYVEVWDDQTNWRLDRVCGSAIPLDLTSNFNTMRVIFHSNPSVAYTGFNATWTSICETSYNSWSWSGDLASPLNSSSSQKECSYIINIPWQVYVVQLTFTSFNLGVTSGSCTNNYVEVRDGAVKDAPLMGRFCNNSLPPVLVSSSSSMWVTFVSSGVSSNRGFSASYTWATPRCLPQNLTDRTGTIKSLLYPNNYPNVADCSWTISGNIGDLVELTFSTFQLEGPAYWCPWDWVKVYDGNNLISTYCGAIIPQVITTESNIMKISFRSDYSVTYQGFLAYYRIYNPNSDEQKRQYDLYPFGPSNGDTILQNKQDNSVEVYIRTGFPVRDTIQRYAYVGSNGLVSFGDNDKGKTLKFKPKKMQILPYNADIDATVSGYVSYRLYTNNATIINKASAQVREFTHYKDYTASLVLVVTWYRVAHKSSKNSSSETATFQLALISNGRLSFAIITWQWNQMKWNYMKSEPLIIGFSNGQESQAILSEYSDTSIGFKKMDKTIGNTGRYGMQIYAVGDKYSPDQVCQDWYDRNLLKDAERQRGFDRLPQCPCSLWFLWGNWAWSRWLDDYTGICYRISLGDSRSVYPYGKECCYTYIPWWWWWWWYIPWGQYISGGRNAGAAMAYNPAYWSLSADYQREDKDAHDICCYQTSSYEYCDMFYSLRPVGQCTTRIPFRFSFTWGDPHMKTLDGGEYTMNGWCEYIMIIIRTASTSFTLQGRTGLAETENGTLTNATVFTAFGAEENGVRVFVELQNGTDGMIIYGNDSDYTNTFKDKRNETVVETEEFTIKNDDGKLVVTFSSGIGLTISVGIKALDISVSMPESFGNQTMGLLGNFNGNKNDDFRFPNDTLVGTNLTDRQIYEKFSPYWTVTQNNTVMRYPPRKGPSDYCHPEFVPIFLDEQPADVLKAAKDLCGEAVACIYDYVATGSRAVASASNSTASTADNREKISKNTVPTLTINGNVTVVEGNRYTFNLIGTDPDVGDVLRYFAVSNGSGTVQLNSNTGDVTVTANSTIPVNMSFYVEDSSNVQSPIYNVPIIVCNRTCSTHGTCDFTSSTVSSLSQTFYYAACNCFPAWTGYDCSNDFDGCAVNPCSAQQTCSDIPAAQQGNSTQGFKCSNCSSGYVKDPNDQTRCLDVDECNGTTRVCFGDNATCVNTPGSFQCTCGAGYRLKSDGRTCEDINECAEHSVSCEQQCVNTNGSYLCQCFEGYNMTSKGTCEADASTNDTCSQAGCAQGCTTSYNASHILLASCFCNAGYLLVNKTACVDRNECSESICSQSCVNTVGSFACTCYPGNVLGSDGRTCESCPSMQYGESCSRTCQCNGKGISCNPVTGCVCRDGWSGTGCEEDIDECVVKPDICGAKICENLNGSYVCNCPTGYAVNASSDVCQDVDECAAGSLLNNCGPKEDCKNTPGTFSCVCTLGYRRDNGVCTDINECDGRTQCQQLCVNTDGSFRCECEYGYTANVDRTSCYQSEDVCAKANQTHCNQGCTLDGNDKPVCICNSGYMLDSDGQTCVDKNECADGTSGCSYTCLNQVPFFKCSCPLGMMLDNDQKTCIACPAGTYGENCAHTCTCGIGSSGCNAITGCVCMSGWTGISCDQDINECDTESVQTECLQRQAQCFNFQGGYRCQCDTGYTTDQNNICRDINECANNPNPCSQVCENSLGSYRCLCNTGFFFNDSSQQCEDVNECALSATNNCTQRCDNTQGSYRCGCDIPGLVLSNDGVTCQASQNCTRNDCPTVNGGCSLENCFCNTGYNLSSNNRTCDFISVDWCAVAKPCQQQCHNTADGKNFYCNCSVGYLLNKDGRTCRECPDNFYGEGCSNMCSCNKQTTLTCNKTSGACICKEGWTNITCDTDVNECASSSVVCPSYSTCFNLEGSYLCSCNSGFFKSNQTCVACDEGFYGDNCANKCDCSVNTASCDKITGACKCNAGWNGTRCDVDVDRCGHGAHNCTGNHVICINMDDSFRCDCSSGYSFNSSSLTCSDIDECFNNTSNCRQVCTNTDGGYNCSCFSDYRGTGNNCTEMKKVRAQLIVNINVNASDLADPSSPKYAEWVRLTEDALFKEVSAYMQGLEEVDIISLSVGSLYIECQFVLDDQTYTTAVSDLLYSLASLDSGTITIGNYSGSVVITINGTSASASQCILFNLVSQCPSGQECQVENGKAVCRTNDKNDVPLIVGLAVGLPLGVILIVVVVVVVVLKKNKSGKGKLFRRHSSVSPVLDPSAKSGGYSRVGTPPESSVRKGSWTNDI